METSNKSTGKLWNDLPLFAEGIPVSLSVQQVVAKVKRILATCGLGFDKPLANYDLATQFWRMSEGTFPSGEQPSLPILPPSGMTRNGALFQQPAWEPLTDVIVSSSWPTPTTQDHIVRKSTQQKPGSMHSVGLGDAVRMWPTPRSSSAMSEDMEKIAERMKEPGAYKARLEEAVSMYPTPTYGKLAGGSGAFQQVQDLYSEGKISDEERKAMQAGNGGKLNPTWVEWLMGFPLGWTDLEDSETP